MQDWRERTETCSTQVSSTIKTFPRLAWFPRQPAGQSFGSSLCSSDSWLQPLKKKPPPLQHSKYGKISLDTLEYGGTGTIIIITSVPLLNLDIALEGEKVKRIYDFCPFTFASCAAQGIAPAPYSTDLIDSHSVPGIESWKYHMTVTIPVSLLTPAYVTRVKYWFSTACLGLGLHVTSPKIKLRNYRFFWVSTFMRYYSI